MLNPIMYGVIKARQKYTSMLDAEILPAENQAVF
jgi:hypothetical protein